MIAQSTYDWDARILRQTAALVKNNINVDLICLGFGKYQKYQELNNIRVHRIMKRFSQDSIVSYIFFSMVFLIKALFKSLSLLLKNKPDVIQVHNMPDYLVFAASFHKIFGVPVVLDIHDLTVELFKAKWGEKKFKLLKPILISVEKLCVKFADKVITVSEPCGECLIERGLPKEKLTIVMNVADSTSFQYDSNRQFNKIEKELSLINHGTIAERYGLHNTIKALPKVIAQIPGTIFHIVGAYDGDYLIYLRNLVRELDIKDNVHFEDPVPHNQIFNKLKLADIAIISEIFNEYSNFGIPTKAFEYAAVGIPCIINDLPICRSVFRDESVCYINSNNAELIADEIIKLCNDAAKRKAMSLNAYEDLQRVSNEKMSKKYLNLINSLSTNKN